MYDIYEIFRRRKDSDKKTTISEQTRHNYHTIIDGQIKLVPVTYEINKYMHRDKIAFKFIAEGWRGAKLVEVLTELGVTNLDDSTQIENAVLLLVKKFVSH